MRNILTKGEMIKQLKKNGIRTGDKNGAKVSLEHLKTWAICNLYFENCTMQGAFDRACNLINKEYADTHVEIRRVAD